MRGSLSEGVLPGLLHDLYVGRRTGRLRFASGAERYAIRFQHGRIILGEASSPDLHLGTCLVRHGQLSEADLARATEAVKREGMRLGQVLYQFGLLDAKQLDQALATHAREILARIFAWQTGDYAFEPEEPEAGLQGDATLELSTGEMILDAVSHVRDPAAVRAALGDVRLPLAPSNDPLLRFQQIPLSPADGFVLSRIDGQLCAYEIIEMTPLPSEQSERSLLRLLSTGIIEHAERATPRAATSANRPAPTARRALHTPPPPAVAPPPPAVAPPPTAAASPAPATTPPAVGPQPGAPPGRGVSGEAEAETRLRLEAQEGINSRTRITSEESLAAREPRVPRAIVEPGSEPAALPASGRPLSAGEALYKAEKLVAAEKNWDAIRLLEPLLAATEGKQRQRIRLVLARVYLKNPHWVHRAEVMLQQAVDDDASDFEAWFALAEIYRATSLSGRAHKALIRVLELQPEHERAARALRAIEAEMAPKTEPKPRGGLLKKLFGGRN